MPASLCERCGYRKDEHKKLLGVEHGSTGNKDLLYFCPTMFYLPSKTGDVEVKEAKKKPKIKVGLLQKTDLGSIEAPKRKRGRPRKITAS